MKFKFLDITDFNMFFFFLLFEKLWLLYDFNSNLNVYALILFNKTTIDSEHDNLQWFHFELLSISYVYGNTYVRNIIEFTCSCHKHEKLSIRDNYSNHFITFIRSICVCVSVCGFDDDDDKMFFVERNIPRIVHFQTIYLNYFAPHWQKYRNKCRMIHKMKYIK